LKINIKNLILSLIIFTVIPELVFCEEKVTPQEQPEDVASPIDQDVVSELNSMFDFLAKAKKLSVTVDSTYDVLQDSGQLIEFGATSTWNIVRPKFVNVNIMNRDGTDRVFYFNGKEIALYDKGENVYATVSKSGTLDDAFGYYMDKLEMPLPLAELFSEHHPFDLSKDIISAAYIGGAIINGINTDNLAFQTEDIDIQIWISTGDKPLPQRIVITYRDAPGPPQYRAQFKDWNLSPKIDTKIFSFKPPEGSEKIFFSPGTIIDSAKKQEKGG